MPYTAPAPAPRRAAASVQHIKSPLTRISFSLARGQGQLVLLHAGGAGLRERSGEMQARAEGPRLIWRANGAGMELVAEAGARGTLVSVPDLALMRALPATPLGEQMRRTLRQDFGFALERPARIGALVEGLEAERAAAGPGAEVAAAHYLALVLLELWRMARADLVAHGRAPQGLAERFVQLAGQHAREHWRVGDYARALGVSRDRLGSAVRRATGLSPQGYLHRELVREASQLLANTGMPVGQVAFRLGFADPAYFTRFFTRELGASPVVFRRTSKARRAAGDQSYAAWP
jgi:AraC family transcriptional activator of pobA